MPDCPNSYLGEDGQDLSLGSVGTKETEGRKMEWKLELNRISSWPVRAKFEDLSWACFFRKPTSARELWEKLPAYDCALQHIP